MNKQATNLKHGMHNTKVYKTWVRMKRRCNVRGFRESRYYGDKGIRYCDRWESFEGFYEDMGNPPTENHTIDRIDPNGHYEPGNCRWLPANKQQRNRTTNNIIEYRGERKPLCVWAEEYGMAPPTLQWRLSAGWSIEDAITTPVLDGNTRARVANEIKHGRDCKHLYPEPNKTIGKEGE